MYSQHKQQSRETINDHLLLEFLITSDKFSDMSQSILFPLSGVSADNANNSSTVCMKEKKRAISVHEILINNVNKFV